MPRIAVFRVMTESAFVAIEGIPYEADRLFEYAVPEAFATLVFPGAVVLCPFGAGDRQRRGVVLSVGKAEAAVRKPLAAVTDVGFALDAELLRLAEYVRGKYFCTYFDAVRCVLPPGIFGATERFYEAVSCTDEELLAYFAANGGRVERRKLKNDLGRAAYTRLLRAVRAGEVREVFRSQTVRARTQRTVAVGPQAEAYLRTLEKSTAATAEKHRAVLRFLTEHGPSLPAEVCAAAAVGEGVLKTLEKKEAVCFGLREQVRDPLGMRRAEASNEPLVLSAEQQAAYEAISAQLGSGKTHLLYGVTGSGKTHVYLALTDRILAEGKCVLLLVPEILLTLQIVDIFCRRYGKEIAVLHSGLSAGERFDEWRRIASGECRIVVGTRSAVFVPLRNLGLILIDEEQEHTYRSEMTPKYSAVEVASFRVREAGALLLTASATPSFERYRAAMEGKIGYSGILQRYNARPLPKTLVVDMTGEQQQGNASLFSRELSMQIGENLAHREQTVLFMNRRGYSSFVSCPSCKYVFRCESCGIPLTYHRAGNELVCHYCGARRPVPALCPTCGGHTLRYAGAGTQKAEEELQKRFPEARILRMDGDTVSKKGERDRIFTAFRRGEADILLGTQMITKGLDFPNVTLVGVLMADSLLYSSDFRAYEKTFSVLTQVIGRAGRAEKEGRAVVQTYSPSHSVLRFAFQQDYEGFFRQESALRKTLGYPPYCDLCQIVFLADTVRRAFEGAEAWIRLVSEAVESEEYARLPVCIIRPRETAVPMEKGRHRVRVLMKCRDITQMRRMLSGLYTDFRKNKEFKDVTVDLTMNPAVIV